MASITIRNLKDDVKKRLRVRAAENGRSMEEEAREILQASVLRSRGFAEEQRGYASGNGGKAARPRGKPKGAAKPAVAQDNFFDTVRKMLEPVGGVELPVLKRKARKLPDFK
jgi:plasmid stability protein